MQKKSVLPRMRLKLIYWSTRNEGDKDNPYGQQEFDLADQVRGDPLSVTAVAKAYQRLYDDPTIYKLEIWRLLTSFERKQIDPE